MLIGMVLLVQMDHVVGNFQCSLVSFNWVSLLCLCFGFLSAWWGWASFI